jgi:uncharacterized protein (TIGR00255 family)
MTGFGSAEGAVGTRRARVEVRSVNHRHHLASVRVPADCAGVEADLRDLLRRRVERGHVTLTLQWVSEPAATMLRVDWDRAAAVVETMREAARRFALSDSIAADQVLRFPEVLGGGADEGEPVTLAALMPVIEAALEEFTAARRREGAVLARELTERLDAIATEAVVVKQALPARLDRELVRLKGAVAELSGGVDVDPARLAQEIAFLADRVDVTEEMVRLEAHVAAAREALDGDRPVGKHLGFLAQEIGREINTLGSKANDAAIAHRVVGMKGDLEKVREQLENLE